MSPIDPLDDVAFLARSPHRVEVLRTLARAPTTRPDLRDKTGISQPTLGRVLGAFEDRNWVERSDRSYHLTPLGELVAESFEGLLDTVETVQGLEDVLSLLPTDEMPFGVERLALATVTTPTTGDVFRHVRRGEELIAGGRQVALVTDTIEPASLGDLVERVEAGSAPDLYFETVITGTALDQAFANPSLVAPVRALVESDRTPVYRYDGPVTMMFGLVDGVAVMVPTDEQGLPCALVESEDEAVTAWVCERFETLRANSAELSPDDLPE